MYKDYKDLDLSKPLNFQQNLKKSIMVTTGSSIIGAVMFFIAYAVTGNVWILSVAIILVISGVAFMFAIQHFQNKFSDIVEGKNNKQKF